jgi:hypothetical protein
VGTSNSYDLSRRPILVIWGGARISGMHREGRPLHGEDEGQMGIIGAHMLLYTPEADALRSTLRECIWLQIC